MAERSRKMRKHRADVGGRERCRKDRMGEGGCNTGEVRLTVSGTVIMCVGKRGGWWCTQRKERGTDGGNTVKKPRLWGQDSIHTEKRRERQQRTAVVLYQGTPLVGSIPPWKQHYDVLRVVSCSVGTNKILPAVTGTVSLSCFVLLKSQSFSPWLPCAAGPSLFQ